MRVSHCVAGGLLLVTISLQVLHKRLFVRHHLNVEGHHFKNQNAPSGHFYLYNVVTSTLYSPECIRRTTYRCGGLGLWRSLGSSSRCSCA